MAAAKSLASCSEYSDVLRHLQLRLKKRPLKWLLRKRKLVRSKEIRLSEAKLSVMAALCARIGDVIDRELDSRKKKQEEQWNQ